MAFFMPSDPLATDKVCQALHFPRIPDHTTLQRTYHKLRKLDFEKMKNQILEEENIEESILLPTVLVFHLDKPVCITKHVAAAFMNTGSKAPMLSGQTANIFFLGNLGLDRVMTLLI